MTDLVRTALPRTALLLAAWLTACGADHGDDKTGSTGAATGSSAGPDTGATGDAASTGAATDDAASTSATTGDAASTGEPADTCACFSSPGPGTFELLCPAEIKAEIDGACAGDDCTYDGVAIAAALAFLATGEPGIVLWTVDDGAIPATASPRPQTRDLGATCPYQYCRGGIHIVTGDGKVFTQTRESSDIPSVVSPLASATLRPALYFADCAQDPDVAARFACVTDPGQSPFFEPCAEGTEF